MPRNPPRTIAPSGVHGVRRVRHTALDYTSAVWFVFIQSGVAVLFRFATEDSATAVQIPLRRPARSFPFGLRRQSEASTPLWLDRYGIAPLACTYTRAALSLTTYTYHVGMSPCGRRKGAPGAGDSSTPARRLASAQNDRNFYVPTVFHIICIDIHFMYIYMHYLYMSK